MKRRLVTALFLLVTVCSYAQKSLLLPNGWRLSPAGKTVQLGGDLPLNMALSPNGAYIAVTNNGVSTQTIQLIDAHKFQILQTLDIPKSWLGIKFSEDSRSLYVSGGNDNRIMVYQISHSKMKLTDSLLLGPKWPEKISPAGLDIAEKEHKLYVVTKENNALYTIDLTTKQATKTVSFIDPCYTCILSPDHSILYISVWGGGKVMIFDTHRNKLIDSVNTGRNPNDLCISKDGNYLFVANSVDNSVSVIDTRSRTVIETLNSALYPDAPQGSTTNAVTLSNDGQTLYIANADNNCLAVFDVRTPGKSTSKGFIPVGWYPTSVKISNRKILVLNGKGSRSMANPGGPQPTKKGEKDNYKKANKKSNEYIGSLFRSSMQVIPTPDAKKMALYSSSVYRNTPYSKDKETVAESEPNNPIPGKLAGNSPIKHVFYIIKENRTYDQVLGDEPKGNGDTSLVLFGKNITPNQHKIAEDFVLLDNFYVDAEVSADGHNWSMAAYANDYVEKNWPTNYGGRGGNYDFVANKPVSTPRAGFIWDYAMRAGLTFRNYGEFTDDDGNTYLPPLTAHTCFAYPGWNLNIKDADREKIWEHDFDSLVNANAVPKLSTIYFPSDHTAGLNKNSRTPFAFVADNDLGVGKFLEHLSNSPVWKECAVFILEDDAQNGPDHIDAHRSPAYLAGPFVKRKYADHTMYSTSGMLRTMELILGLPPMSQYDAGATPMFRSFTENADTSPFTCLNETVDMNEKNTADNGPLEYYSNFELAKADRIPDIKLNNALWRKVKGSIISSPPPCRAGFVTICVPDDDDDN